MSIVFDIRVIEFAIAVGFDGEVEVLNRDTNDLHRCRFRSRSRTIGNRESVLALCPITYVSCHSGPMPVERYQP